MQKDQKNRSFQHPDDDEDKSTVGVNPDLYPDPEGRKEEVGSIDAPWGESDVPPGKTNANSEQYSDAAWEQYIEGRQEMLDDIFASKQPASKAEQALVRGLLQHGASNKFESRAPLLESEATDPAKEAAREFFDNIVD